MNAIVERAAHAPQTWDDRPAPAISETLAMIQLIERMAMNPEINIERVQQLISMQERMEERQFARNSKMAYDAAFAIMQGQLPIIAEDKEHGGTKSTYATFDAINQAIRPALSENGFSLKFRIHQEAAKVSITGILAHKGGYSEETTIELPVDTGGQKNNVQAIGSTQSYGQRYVTKALLSLSSRKSDDDNGDKGGGSPSISEDQCQTLLDRMREVSADFPKFLAYFKLQELADLPAKRFAEAIATLDRKGRKS